MESDKRCALAIVALCSIAGFVTAHDSWLFAEPMNASPGAEVRLVFGTGETFPKSEHGADPARVADWILVDDSGRKTVTDYTVERDSLVARIKVETEGLHMAAIALKPKFIELEPAKFEEYLKDEGATAAMEQRAAADKTSEPGREYYTKFAKTYIDAGDYEEQPVYWKPVGHDFEIVPLQHPHRLSEGEVIKVRVLLRGKPAEGVAVSSGYDGVGRAPHGIVRTDADGIAEFRRFSSGLWYVKAHVVEPMPDANQPSEGPRADWRSYWASITFRVAPLPEPGLPRGVIGDK